MSHTPLARRSLVVPLLATGLLAGLSTPADAGSHEDPRIGFKIDVPKGWNAIPIDTDEGWIVAKFLHDKKDHFTDPTTGWTYPVQPTIQVVAFVDEIIHQADVESDDDEEKEDGVERKVRFQVYQDYLDYMRTTYTRGFFVAEETEDEQDGKPVESLVLQTQGSGPPIRIFTNIYTVDSGKVAVHIEMLEDGYRKLRRDVSKIFRSFEEIPRTEAIDSNPVTGGYISLVSLDGLSPEEREVRRREMLRKEWERIVGSLTEDWESYEIDGIPVVTHADKRHAKKVVANVVAVRGWLDETFPEFGQEEYVRPPILRICESREEENAFRRGTAWGSGRSTEVVTHKDQSGATGWEWDYVNEQTLRLWFQERDRQTYNGLPAWFWFGLRELVGEARAKGSRLEFVESSTERILARRAEREGGIMPLKQLMMLKRRDFLGGDSREDANNVGQAMTALRFFVDGPGSKRRQWREVIPTYLRNLRDVLQEIEDREDADDDGEEEDEPQTEEEEEEYLRKRREAAQAREQEILEETFHRTFADWDDRDWEALERQYEKAY